MSEIPFIQRIVIENYRNITFCDVKLRPITYLIGPNGAGKSNFLDVINFITDALNFNLQMALSARRTGFHKIIPRFENAKNFGIKLEIRLDSNTTCDFSFRIADVPSTDIIIEQEQCVIKKNNDISSYYIVNNEQIKTSLPQPYPPQIENHFFLVSVSKYPGFDRVYNFLFGMNFYDFNLYEMVKTLSKEPNILSKDGSNLNSVITRMLETAPDMMDHIRDYLQKIQPEVSQISQHNRQQLVTLITFAPTKKGWYGEQTLELPELASGTLRTLGILVALFQDSNSKKKISLIGIEEPENGIHPAALGVIIDAIQEAGQKKQILITTHSPELLDNKDIEPDSFIAFSSKYNEAIIGSLDEATSSVLRDHLFTGGELLSMGQLKPAEKTASNDKEDTDTNDKLFEEIVYRDNNS